MYRRMIAAIIFFMILGAAMIIAIAFSVAEKDGNKEPVSEEEVLVIRHLLDLELEELESDTVFMADICRMNENLNISPLTDQWKKEETFLNLGIDSVSVISVNGTILYHSSLKSAESIASEYAGTRITNKTSGFIHLDGFTCMFCQVPVKENQSLVFIRIVDIDLIGDLNPFPDIRIKLHNVIEGPVSEGVIEIANGEEQQILSHGSYHLKISDFFNKTIAVLELSK